MNRYTPTTHGKSGVYKIVCKLTGKQYIGSTVNIYRRWKNHETVLKKQKHYVDHLQNMYDQYGLSAMSFEVICFCDNYREVEQNIIDFAIGNAWCLNKQDKVFPPRQMTEEQIEKFVERQRKPVIVVHNDDGLVEFDSQKAANEHYQVDLKKYMSGIRSKLPRKICNEGVVDVIYKEEFYE